MHTIGFLGVPETTADSQRIFDEDVAELGHVMNLSRLWAYQPATVTGLFNLLRQAISTDSLSLRQRLILVAACASTFGDSYCSLAWGSKLAAATDAQTAAGVLRGMDDGLSVSERAMAGWARKVARDPNGTTAADVQVLRDAGFSDSQIFTITVFVALRLAFSTVNDALGVRPMPVFVPPRPQPCSMRSPSAARSRTRRMSSDHISEAIETARKYVAEHPNDARCAPQSSAYRFSALR